MAVTPKAHLDDKSSIKSTFRINSLPLKTPGDVTKKAGNTSKRLSSNSGSVASSLNISQMEHEEAYRKVKEDAYNYIGD